MEKTSEQKILEACRQLLQEKKTPVYLYSEENLKKQAQTALEMPFMHSHRVRFAIKSNSNRNIIHFFDRMGLHFDASSEYEAQRMLKMGIRGEKILLTSQQCAKNPQKLLEQKVMLNACSLHQLKTYAPLAAKSNAPIAIRFNPGDEYKIDFKRNVSGIQSSFGIWHEQLDEAFAIAKQNKTKVKTLHSHVGSGTGDNIWVESAKKSLKILGNWHEIDTINLGGGFWVDRLHKKMADLTYIAHEVNETLKDFTQRTGRKIDIEIEPGTFLVARSGHLLMSIDDLCHTGEHGHRFVKLDGGMNDYIRPSIYKARHRISHLKKQAAQQINQKENMDRFVLVGHCCENGDILSAGEKTENFSTVKLHQPEIGDGIVIHDVGAYGSSMANTYNSYPFSAEYWLNLEGNLKLIRKKQRVEEIFSQEIDIL